MNWLEHMFYCEGCDGDNQIRYTETDWSDKREIVWIDLATESAEPIEQDAKIHRITAAVYIARDGSKHQALAIAHQLDTQAGERKLTLIEVRSWCNLGYGVIVIGDTEDVATLRNVAGDISLPPMYNARADELSHRLDGSAGSWFAHYSLCVVCLLVAAFMWYTACVKRTAPGFCLEN